MFPQPSKLRAKLAAGQCVFGTAIYSCSPNVVEAAALSGVDFVRMDSEHLWRRDDSMDHMVRAALVAGATPIIRIDRDDHQLARKAFEIGAGAVVVSNIRSAEEARGVVQDARFPPLGGRGIGTLCLSGQWGRANEQDWVDWSNREPLLGVMIESWQAVEEVEAIMAVDGIDYVAFGPSDFGMSLSNRESEFIKEQKLAALTRTIRAARNAGKHCFYGVGLSGDLVENAIALGADMIELSHDVVMVRSALNPLVEKFSGRSSIRPL